MGKTLCSDMRRTECGDAHEVHIFSEGSRHVRLGDNPVAYARGRRPPGDMYMYRGPLPFPSKRP